MKINLAPLVSNVNKDIKIPTGEIGDKAISLEQLGFNITGGFVDVRSTGAVGNGIADDTEAIQAAIDTGYPVLLPIGVFKITATLTLGQSDFTGCGAKNSIIDADGCDALEIPLAASRNTTRISGFSIQSLSENVQDFRAIYFTKDTGNTGVRSSGFKFSYLEIGKQGLEQFGAAFMISDAFRVSLENIGINNCHSAVLLVGQVVQFGMKDVYSNYDERFSSAGFDDVDDQTTSYGLYVGSSDHTGSTQLPESIKATDCGFVYHAVGLYNYDSLHARFINLDLDYCTSIGLRVFATNGFTLKDTYIAVTGAALVYGMKFEVTAFEVKNVNIENNFITSLAGATHPDKIAIFFADNFREGGNIIANEIRADSTDASHKWKHGIYMTQSKRFTVSKNVILENSVTDEGIYCDSVEDFNLTENFCPDSDILYSIGAGSFYVHNNICTAISQTATGTSKGYSLQPENVILKNANISTGIVQYDPSGVLKTGMIDTAANFNSLTTPGEYANTHNTNSPDVGYGIYFVSVKRSAGYITQIAYPVVTTDTPIRWYIRASQDGGGTWSAWRGVQMV